MGSKFRVRSDDVVEIIAGNNKGARGKVLRALPGEGKVVVEGVNLVWKHVKPSRLNPRGGRIQVEAPLAASKVMPVCPNRECAKFDRGVRVRYQVSEDRMKSRRCAKCGAEIRATQ